MIVYLLGIYVVEGNKIVTTLPVLLKNRAATLLTLDCEGSRVPNWSREKPWVLYNTGELFALLQ